MRRYLVAGISAFAFLGLVWAGVFAWKNLRGIAPAILKPPADIGDIVSQPPFPENPEMVGLSFPDGFSVSIFAGELGSPRVLARDPQGTLLVSDAGGGRVLAVPDGDGNGTADRVAVVLRGLSKPHGIAFEPGGEQRLYVAETNRIVRYHYNPVALSASEGEKIADLPSGGGHSTRTIRFGPDGRLYATVGSSCNVCYEDDERRAAMLVMDPDGKNQRVFARGLRNTVFFAWSPFDGTLWGTDMGRDLLGDDVPPDELNVIVDGGNYGWPTCYGKNIHDAAFDSRTYVRNPCLEPFETPSAVDFQAHSAPLGLAFIPPMEHLPSLVSAWPDGYERDLIVAFHGSWNRSVPTGYKLVRVKFGREGQYEGTEDFVTGWLTPSGALGRPVDVLIGTDGVMYISDDKAGVIYRIAYRPR